MPGATFDPSRGTGIVGRFPAGPSGAPAQFFEQRIGLTPRAADGRTLLATVGFRYDLPIQGGRLQPYVGGGLGIARTSTEFTFARSLIVPARPGSVEQITESATHTGMAAAAGVGTSLRVFRMLFVDVDARYFRLDRDRDLVRFGGGVSYRF